MPRNGLSRTWPGARRWAWDYLPVVFPGFSWHNMHVARGESAPLNQIPRLKGEFLWSQAVADYQAGAKMLYVAMFDEIDEGTAIFQMHERSAGGGEPVCHV